MPLTSMTGFADLAGETAGAAWVWEARSVNGRGLDLRFRAPDGLEGLEGAVRAAAAARMVRGSVTVALRVERATGGALARLNPEALEAAIAALLAAGDAAARRGLDTAPITAADLLGLRGVLDVEARPGAEDPGVVAALTAQAPALVERLAAAREAEGAALARVLAGQADRIAELAGAARIAADARGARAAETLRARVEAVLTAAGGGGPVDAGRLAQELALLAVKADVTEELDRLEAHVAAARLLLEGEGPAGRKLDFLSQEFNREANTLTSKAQSAELTAIGLDLKVAVDRFREQVQNVE